MIQTLASRYQKYIAYCFLLVFITALALPVSGRDFPTIEQNNEFYGLSKGSIIAGAGNVDQAGPSNSVINAISHQHHNVVGEKMKKADIGGPSQPESSKFKSASSDNLVNLFTGDFSYNIPLMDVGGYPINIFYDGGITPEQEASWVGLGWNINPGTISRNTRGVPDDFNGEDKLTTTQSMKPNITWGGRLGADFEAIGIKELPLNLTSLGGSLGVSVNNYLGPALEKGIKGGASFKVASLASSEKVTDQEHSKLSLGVGVNANLSSRGGLTITPYASFSANKIIKDHFAIGGGLGLSTGYNSRTGLSNLHINGQFRFSEQEVKKQSIQTREAMQLGNSIGSISPSIVSTAISFLKPSYIPSIRMPITNEAISGHFQIGGGLWGFYTSGETEVFKQTSFVAPEDVIQTKPMVGYLYYQMANSNSNSVVDFTRFNDKEVTPNTQIISAPQYSYDVFSISGEGTGGSIRLFRNDYGYVRDNYTGSQDKSLSIGGDVGIPGHYGANVNVIKTPSTIGEWNANNKLRSAIPFKQANGLNENVYFRNPGETSVLEDDQFDKIGGTNLVRFKLAGDKMNPSVEPVLQKISSNYQVVGEVSMLNTSTSMPVVPRKKRTQVVTYLTAAEAQDIGLNKEIRNYDAGSPLTTDNNLAYTTLSRIDGTIRKAHHISQINVTEANGSRYIYDVPVYNNVEKEFTFTVNSVPPDFDGVEFNPDEASPNSPWLSASSKKDGYLQINQTPAYAHSFLLGGLLSADYVDVRSDGITEDDLGNAVKFNYTRIKRQDGSPAVHRWRTPHGIGSLNTANFNPGNRTNEKDDKGNILYGERESWYLHSIESKTMIALFTLEDRLDGKGAANELGGMALGDDAKALKRLKKIDLYSKADLKKNGLTGSSPAKPIKTVSFEYNYELSGFSSDNSGDEVTGNENKGKLTLKGIFFTFNGQSKKSHYKFGYGANPNYQTNASDRWGNYKPHTSNPEYLKNSSYPYSFQPKNPTEADIPNYNAGVWNLNKILLPSGGQMEVEYESDDYAFVQDRRAANMMRVSGFGKTNNSFDNDLYSPIGFSFNEHNYVLIEVPEACSTKQEVLAKYLQGQEQLAFRLAVQMIPGAQDYEYLTAYGIIDYTATDNYGIYGTASDKKIWVKLKTVTGLSPLSVTALEYLKEQLPGQAFPGYDVSEGTTLQQFAGMINGMIGGLKNAFRDPIEAMRLENKARYTELSKCFVRLNDPDGRKYGGGHRVKKVVLKDNWDVMTSQYKSEYGTEYDYTITEVFNGQERLVSSGVASYEPSIGGEENPFQTMLQVVDKLPLGPTSYGSIELPVLDAFFPAPLVGYSKVTTRSLKRGTITTGMKSRSGVGRQVTEFYTARDFPVRFQYSMLDEASDVGIHKNSFGAFFWKWAFDSRAISQGFLVMTNDMHGKLKSQAGYAENDPTLRVSFTQNFYRNTGVNGLNEKFDFAHSSLGGAVKSGNMGIDIELMTDTREFSVKSTSQEIQAQLDHFPTLEPLAWLPFVWPVKAKCENVYRAVTCTKVINYHSVVDKVLVIDKGSEVTTENLVYDAETGDVIVSRTNNEFDRPIYTVSFPAYWAYSGMGPAYKNINALFKGINFVDGEIKNSQEALAAIESGDELYVFETGTEAGCTPEMVSDETRQLIWALDKGKNLSSLTNTSPHFIFLDAKGKPYSRTGVTFRIVRSGKRNLLKSPVGAITMMANPVIGLGSNRKLVANSDFAAENKGVVNASVVEYKEKWHTDKDAFNRYRLVTPSTGGNLIVNGDFSQGNSGFTTEYTFHPSSYTTTNPYYSIATTSSGWNPTTVDCADHTSGSGNMMLVDGATDYERVVWSQTVTVTPNTNYLLSAWAMDIQQTVSHHLTQLRFKINGSQVGPIFGLGAVYPCVWKKYFNSWYSGSSTTAVIEISSKDLVANGNDFALDDISFIVEPCAINQVEEQYCDGYLEKSINPYQKGLLGDFKANVTRVFYGERMENNPLTATHLLKNGFLKDFGLYWKFINTDDLYRMVPDANYSAKWVGNFESTKYNAKGMELETKDALGIYTSAQYGYKKTLPVAITGNSRYNEMMYEGFEDNDYAETLNNAASNCVRKHIDFTGLDNTQILNSDVSGVAAHTGKYAMGVTSGQVATKAIPVEVASDESFAIDFQTTTVGQLNDPGGNFINNGESGQPPATVYNREHYFSDFGARVYTRFSTGSSFYSYSYKTVQYFEINTGGTYSFFTSSQRVSDNSSSLSPGTMNWTVKSVASGANIPYTIAWSSNTQQHFQTRAEICLPKGVYVLECTYSGAQNSSCPTCNTSDTYDIYIENNTYNVKTYKSTAIQNSCTYTRPLAGSEAMMNPAFSLTPGKKMVFSAWVRESDSEVSSYEDNEVQIDFGTGNSQNSTLEPSGPIIEGWQRYEGYFTAPAGASSMNLKLVNNSSGMVYFDDIRIHPFNANMKTYVYDPVSLKLTALLDGNNYASFYEYDAEGSLVRTKVETKEGVKTLKETRRATQKTITEIQ